MYYCQCCVTINCIIHFYHSPAAQSSFDLRVHNIKTHSPAAQSFFVLPRPHQNPLTLRVFLPEVPKYIYNIQQRRQEKKCTHPLHNLPADLRVQHIGQATHISQLLCGDAAHPREFRQHLRLQLPPGHVHLEGDDERYVNLSVNSPPTHTTHQRCLKVTVN